MDPLPLRLLLTRVAVVVAAAVADIVEACYVLNIVIVVSPSLRPSLPPCVAIELLLFVCFGEDTA